MYHAITHGQKKEQVGNKKTTPKQKKHHKNTKKNMPSTITSTRNNKVKIDGYIDTKESALTMWTQELGIIILLKWLDLKDYIDHGKKITYHWLKKLTGKTLL